MSEKKLIAEGTENINVGGHKELIADGTNAFGGKNPAGLYVPMSDDEQEVLEILADGEELELVIHGWGTIPNPVMVVGDHRIRIDFRVTFAGVLVSRPVHYIDLELRLQNGMTVYKDRKPTLIGGQPLVVTEGEYVDMQWDIAIEYMDPAFVRAIKPGTVGLTSRRQDKATREMTGEGNMHLNHGQRKLLRKLEQGQGSIRKMDEVAAVQASAGTGEKLVKTRDGVEYQPIGER
jgi:hypothetical protein